jgi:hypothetical protein
MLLSITPPPRPLSVSKPVLTSISPVFHQPSVQSALAALKQKPVITNYPSNTLNLGLYKQQNKSPIWPASILNATIPQLDGSAYDPQNQPQPDSIKCETCQKRFETNEDFKWHNETQYGREDCSILRSMLPY